jgi:hypothetical protein
VICSSSIALVVASRAEVSLCLLLFSVPNFES